MDGEVAGRTHDDLNCVLSLPVYLCLFALSVTPVTHEREKDTAEQHRAVCVSHVLENKSTDK